MSARKKTKLCWHCHGTIAAEASHCPYCGERCEAPKEAPSYFPPEIEEEPLELTENSQKSHLGESMPRRLSTARNWLTSRVKNLSSQREGQTSVFAAFIPLLCYSYGLFLANCAICLCLFSRKGVLRLEFSSGWWWWYLCFASALIWCGSLYCQPGSEHREPLYENPPNPLEEENDAH